LEPATILKIKSVETFQRGDGVLTTLLVGAARIPEAKFTSGLTSFPPGRNVPFHSHNCGEQVLVLEGEAEVEVDGRATRLGKHDSAYISANKPHRYRNIGAAPLLILWIYDSPRVTRTFTETGETVEHLSPGDTVAKR
jgi:quercetin dioxygenase-like cupin family protein